MKPLNVDLPLWLAAAALAAFAGSAAATPILDGNCAPGGACNQSYAGPGDLFLSVYDETNNKSGTVKLEINYDDFIAGAVANEWDLTDFLADLGYTATDTLSYNIFAAKTYDGLGSVANVNVNYGMLASRVTGDQTPDQRLSNGNMVTLTSKIQQRLLGVNENLAPLGPWADNYEISATTDLPSHWNTTTGVQPWMSGVDGNQVYFDTDAQVGGGKNETVDIYWIHQGSADIVKNNVLTGTTHQDKLAGTFSLDPAGAKLAFSGAGGGGAATPVLGTIDAFGDQVVGTPSAAKTVTLSNTGSVAYPINGITAGGDFAVTDDCAGSVAAGASCNIQVIFTPATAGARSGTLTVTSAASSPLTRALSGTGIANAVLGDIDAFAGQAVGTTSPAKAVSLTNNGTSAYAISSIAASGDFAITNDCAGSVAAGGSCTIQVTFTPTATGARSGTLTVTPASGSPLTRALSGTGLSNLEVLPTQLDFGAVKTGKKAQLKVRLRNIGGSDLTVGSVTAPSDPFRIVANPCSNKRLKPGKTCTVGYRFAPTGEETFSATSTISPAGSDVEVALSGSGGTVGELAVAPTPVQNIGFGGQFSVTGQEFSSKKGRLLVGGKPAAIVVWTDTLIIAKAPKLRGGAYDVTVVRKGVRATATGLVVLHAPQLTALSATSGSSKSTLGLSGQYFGAKKPKVVFKSTTSNKKKPATVRAFSDGALEVKVPQLPAGDYEVTVANFAGTSDVLTFTIE